MPDISRRFVDTARIEERQYFSVLAIIVYESVALDSGVYVIKDSFRP